MQVIIGKLVHGKQGVLYDNVELLCMVVMTVALLGIFGDSGDWHEQPVSGDL